MTAVNFDLFRLTIENQEERVVVVVPMDTAISAILTGMTGSGYLSGEWFGISGSKPETKSIIYGYKHGIDPREAYVVRG